MRELTVAVRTSPVPYIRVKALAVLNVARGSTRQEVAALVCAHRASVGAWGAAVPAGRRGGVGGRGRSRAVGAGRRGGSGDVPAAVATDLRGGAESLDVAGLGPDGTESEGA